MAELFILGQLIGAKDFIEKSLFCKWKLVAGKFFLKIVRIFFYKFLITDLGSGWKFLEGITEAQTQIDTSSNLGFACWSHPIDIHLATKGIQGWPKLVLEVWHRDQLDRCSLISYGVVNIPSQPGYSKLTCKTWRPIGSIVDRLVNLFSGETLQLADESFIHSHEHRLNLQTESMGNVELQLNIILKDFDKFGVETH